MYIQTCFCLRIAFFSLSINTDGKIKCVAVHGYQKRYQPEKHYVSLQISFFSMRYNAGHDYIDFRKYLIGYYSGRIRSLDLFTFNATQGFVYNLPLFTVVHQYITVFGKGCTWYDFYIIQLPGKSRYLYIFFLYATKQVNIIN